MNKPIWTWALPMIAIGTITAGYSGKTRAAESEGGLLHDRFAVSLGTFMLNTNTKLKLDGTGGNLGTEIDTEKDLGLRDADRFRLDATWRFASRHKVRTQYFDVRQSRTKVLERSVTIDDTVYDVDAEISTKFSTKVFALSYEYAFMQKDNYEITGSAGLHALKFNFSATGTGTVNGQGAAQVRTETAAVTAPLPVFGLRGLWEFSPQWYLDAQGQYFSIKVDKIDGRVTDLRVGVTRMFGEHFGVGAGWNKFTTKLGIDKPSFNGDMRWRYSGAQIFLTASF